MIRSSPKKSAISRSSSAPQITAHRCANSLVDEETQRRFKATYPEIHKRCKETTGGFIHDFDRRAALDLPREERRAVYEQLWALLGFGKWLGNFRTS